MVFFLRLAIGVAFPLPLCYLLIRSLTLARRTFMCGSPTLRKENVVCPGGAFFMRIIKQKGLDLALIAEAALPQSAGKSSPFFNIRQAFEIVNEEEEHEKQD